MKSKQQHSIDVEEEMRMIGAQMKSCKQTMAVLEDKYWNRISFVPGDPHVTSYQEGQRAVVGFLKQCLGEI